jgi:hypothetical protein
MAKATKKSSTNIVTAHPIGCPVVDLAQQLADIWEADEGCEHNYIMDEPKRLSYSTGSEIMWQLSDWRHGIIEIISFTRAKGLAGALVQMSLAVDELETMLAQDGEDRREYRFRIERLIGLAALVIKTSMGSAEYQSVEAMLQTNGLRHISGGDWLPSVKTWEKQGRAIREKRTEERQRKGA